MAPIRSSARSCSPRSSRRWPSRPSCTCRRSRSGQERSGSATSSSSSGVGLLVGGSRALGGVLRAAGLRRRPGRVAGRAADRPADLRPVRPVLHPRARCWAVLVRRGDVRRLGTGWTSAGRMRRKPVSSESVPTLDGDPPAGHAVRRTRPPDLVRHTESARTMTSPRSNARRTSSANSPMSGWAFGAGPKTRHRPLGRRIGPLLLLLPLVFGIVGAPGSAPAVHGDELSEARARQARIREGRRGAAGAGRRLQALQTDLARRHPGHRQGDPALNADQGALSKKITSIANADRDRPGRVRLPRRPSSAAMDAQLVDLEAREAAKKAELAERKALLAERIRTPTTPIARRCSNRSCPAGPLRMCSPR